MFKIGDIVRPKISFIGHNYCFKIIEVEMNRFDDNAYKLQGIKQNLDPLLGSTFIIDKVEELWWKEEDIELTSNIKPHYDITGTISSPNGSDSSVLSEMEKKLTKLIKINKEGNKMQILDLYEERKVKALEKEILEAKSKIKEQDEIQSIILEMTNQVNTILENQGRKIKYEFEPNLITTETEVKLDELDKKYHEEIKNLRSTLDEIRALFELTADYNERIKILKNYDILDKKGKLNV